MAQLSTRTLEEYNNCLRKLNEKNIDYKTPTDVNQLINEIKEIKTKKGVTIQPPSVKIYLIAILWYMKENNVTDGKEILSDEIKKINKKMQEIIDTNTLIGTQKENYIEWEEILKVYNDISKNYYKCKNKHKNYVLLSCYVLFPPRRLQDYSLMYVKNEEDEIEKSKNYYIKSKGYFIFQEYKTKNKYGTQKIDVGDKLKDIIENYIDKYNINESLFDLSYKNVNNKLSNMFIRKINKKVSVNILRHSYITYIKNSGKLNELEIKNKLAFIMAHSSIMQDQYYKNKDKIYDTVKTNDDNIIKWKI